MRLSRAAKRRRKGIEREEKRVHTFRGVNVSRIRRVFEKRDSEVPRSVLERWDLIAMASGEVKKGKEGTRKEEEYVPGPRVRIWPFLFHKYSSIVLHPIP